MCVCMCVRVCVSMPVCPSASQFSRPVLPVLQPREQGCNSHSMCIWLRLTGDERQGQASDEHDRTDGGVVAVGEWVRGAAAAAGERASNMARERASMGKAWVVWVVWERASRRGSREKAVAALAGLATQSARPAACLQGGHALLITPQGRPLYPRAHAPPITGRRTRCQAGG